MGEEGQIRCTDESQVPSIVMTASRRIQRLRGVNGFAGSGPVSGCRDVPVVISAHRQTIPDQGERKDGESRGTLRLAPKIKHGVPGTALTRSRDSLMGWTDGR